MDYKTARTLVSAYAAVEQLNEALTTLAKADPTVPNFKIEFTLGVPAGQWNHNVVVDAKRFRDQERGRIAAFLIDEERRRLSQARAAHIRTINQIGGVTPAPHPFAI